MKPKRKFSPEIRAFVVTEYFDTEKSAREISDETGVSTASIGRWVREVRDLSESMGVSLTAATETWAIQDEDSPAMSGAREDRTAVPA